MCARSDLGQVEGPTLSVEKDRAGHYAVFTISRPHVRNALSVQWWDEFTSAVEEFNADAEMRAGILTGAGSVFCAGRDLKELASFGHEERRLSAPSSEQRALCSSSPKPFICAVNGMAIGAGVERALDCDIRLACDNATFRLPEPRWGMVAATAVHLLPRVVGMGNALFLLLTGEEVDAQSALRMGLVQEVVSDEELLPRAKELARSVAKLDPGSVAASKEVAHLARLRESQEAIRRLREITSARADLSTLGAAAFVAKQDPDWGT